MIGKSHILKNCSKKQNKPLTKEQVAVLLHFCFCNAKDLYEEAEILREKEKYARAFYLCVVALEELAKIPIALNAAFIPIDDKKAWRGFWNTFSSHAQKQGAAKAYGKTILKVTAKDRWDQFYKNQVPEELPFNEMKLASLYVDCYDGAALRPNEIFKQEVSIKSIFEVTKNRIDGFSKFHSTFDGSAFVVEMTTKTSFELDGGDMKNQIIEHFRKLGK